LDYDDKGALRTGTCNHSLLNELNRSILPKKTPKSLGFEFVKETIFLL
jgi:hypothetical protein